MEEKSYTIGEIAQLFQVPASTIRYWEEKEIFSSKRNDENDYREYTIQTTIELLDVVFYRNLNVPIQKMKNFNRLSPEEIYSILLDTEKNVQKELADLEKKSKGISQRKEQLESLFTLKQRGYKEEELTIKKIVPFDMMSREDMQIQLEHLANFVLYKENKEDQFFQMGLVVTDDYKKDELWRLDTSKKLIYLTCLLECDSEDFDVNNLAEHEQALKEKGYKINRIIAPYLATASNNNKQPVDYYKAWLEVESII